MEKTVPQRLKPNMASVIYGTAEAVPFQDRPSSPAGGEVRGYFFERLILRHG